MQFRRSIPRHLGHLRDRARICGAAELILIDKAPVLGMYGVQCWREVKFATVETNISQRSPTVDRQKDGGLVLGGRYMR
jgi:hypothetical protein